MNIGNLSRLNRIMIDPTTICTGLESATPDKKYPGIALKKSMCLPALFSLQVARRCLLHLHLGYISLLYS